MRVARLADVPPGGLVSVQAGHRTYALANVGGVLYALDNNCPHNGGPLGTGTLVGQEVSSGRNCWPGTDWRAMRVPVRVVGDEVWLPVL